MGAASVDHVTYVTAEDIDALAQSSTVATLLPGADFSTRNKYPDARALLDAGVTVALGADCNPGTCYTTSLPFCIAIAVRDMHMTPAEAVWAATAGGARALQRTDVGTLSLGTRADAIALDAPSYLPPRLPPGRPSGARGLEKRRTRHKLLKYTHREAVVAHQIAVDIEPKPWTGRSDGTTAEHLRWHHAVQPYSAETAPGDCVLIGFPATKESAATRAAAAPRMARTRCEPGWLPWHWPNHCRFRTPEPLPCRVEELEAGQAALGNAVSAALDSGHFPVVLGEDTKSPTARISASRGLELRTAGAKLGILNLDAHFDLRGDPIPSSGTPFRQIAEDETAAGTSHQYSVIGISQPSNTHGTVRHGSPPRCSLSARRRMRSDRPRRRGSVPSQTSSTTSTWST